MKITDISVQTRNINRVNIGVNGKYRFSLNITQLVELGIKVGREYTEEEIDRFEEESIYGKLYVKTLDYCLVRPRSTREVQNYLRRKTRAIKKRSVKTGEVIEVPAIKWNVADRVIGRLIEKKYLDDKRFTEFWVENRFLKKGISSRRLRMELIAKGIDATIIEEVMAMSEREDLDELAKLISKKRTRYPDDNKLIQYLMRQGFQYSDIKTALDNY